MKRPTATKRAIAADHVDVMDLNRLPAAPPVKCSTDNKRPPVLILGDKVCISPDPDAQVRRWLRKYAADLCAVFYTEKGHPKAELNLFLMALTLIEHKKAVEKHDEWVKKLEQTAKEFLVLAKTASSRGVKLKELCALTKRAKQADQDIEEAKYEFSVFSTQANERTGYNAEEAKCFLSDIAASAATSCDANGPSILNLISKSIERATIFAEERWNMDEKVRSAMEDVLSRNRESGKTAKPPINEVYAMFAKKHRPAVQKAVRRLGCASFFKPDPRCKSG